MITFKNPYLGNTCVPFQHWACSLSCAQAIEIPARHEQIAAALELDREYDAYVQECENMYTVTGSAGRRLGCHLGRSPIPSVSESDDEDVDSFIVSAARQNCCDCIIS